MAASSFRVVSNSRTCGMFSRVTGSSVSNAAAMHGSAAFFAPLMRTSAEQRIAAADYELIHVVMSP